MPTRDDDRIDPRELRRYAMLSRIDRLPEDIDGPVQPALEERGFDYCCATQHAEVTGVGIDLAAIRGYITAREANALYDELMDWVEIAPASDAFRQVFRRTTTRVLRAYGHGDPEGAVDAVLAGLTEGESV